MFSFSPTISFNVKNNNTIDSIPQKPAKGIVTVVILEPTNVNNPTISAITTGIFAIVTLLAICIKDLFFSLLNPYVNAEIIAIEHIGAINSFIISKNFEKKCSKKLGKLPYLLNKYISAVENTLCIKIITSQTTSIIAAIFKYLLLGFFVISAIFPSGSLKNALKNPVASLACFFTFALLNAFVLHNYLHFDSYLFPYYFENFD